MTDDKRMTREQLEEWATEGSMLAREALTLMAERDEARAALLEYSENGTNIITTLRRENEQLQAKGVQAWQRCYAKLERENKALRELHEKADDLRAQVIEYDKVDEEQELLVAVVTNAEFHALCDALDKLDAARRTSGSGDLADAPQGGGSGEGNDPGGAAAARCDTAANQRLSARKGGDHE